jgi:eukaryotic-like serine/threonine-protein kinase
VSRPAGELPARDLPAGAEIGPGRSVLKALGGGNRFEVLLVWDDRRLAVMVAKVLRPHLVDDRRVLEDLRLEAEALEALAHPVIVRGFDAVLEGEHPHLLIEHLEGPTLRSLIKRGGPLPLQQLLPLALHVAAACHYLAAEGWVHLDIKPDNLVMGIPPRLIDLSLAARLEDAAGFRGPLGTDAYMPPEQCGAGRGTISSPADVWGLGATLWHAVTGARPFPREPGDRDSTDREVRFPQLVRAPEPLPRDTPPELAALLREMLDPEPSRRPQAADVVARLEPLVAELPRRAPLRRGRG